MSKAAGCTGGFAYTNNTLGCELAQFTASTALCAPLFRHHKKIKKLAD